ncbi:serine protease SP24D-like [Episyrphus balteatus]|uniref:serine protease SP24D-like n=1 Tax=Episyrphus balteatus TaxID=286459 RepID=UPI002486B915|nr:serine protease SP24D-like [Episyrphus balteatus]
MVPKSLLLLVITLLFCTFVKAQPGSRIFGGKDAEVGQFPHQVALYIAGDFTCGGSIISSRYILTAAHCVNNGHLIEPIAARDVTIRVGSIQLLAGGKIVAVKNIIIRETFGNWLDDIALLELQEELVFTENIQKIDLFTGEVPKNAPIVISGWGLLNYNGQSPQRLQYGTLRKLDPSECDAEIGYGIDSIICLGHDVNNGACTGDAGGPATYDGKLVGVNSFIVYGCGSWKPDAFGKVSYHRDWIIANMS